jgi:hypothetical protein
MQPAKTGITNERRFRVPLAVFGDARGGSNRPEMPEGNYSKNGRNEFGPYEFRDGNVQE